MAGSSGKGSISIYLSRLLQSDGQKTGLFTSPHLITPLERIQLNSQNISDNDLYIIFQYYKNNFSGIPISYFDFFTFAAIHYFIKQKADWAILETGLGGRLDSTNIIHPHFIVFTPISLDHTEILGNSIEEISREKSGIIKKKVPVYSAPQSSEAREVLIEASREQKSEILFFEKNLAVNETEDYTQHNIDFSKWVFQSFFKKKPSNNIKRQIRARFEIRKRKPLIIFDGAHNYAAMNALGKKLSKVIYEKGILKCHIIANTMQERGLCEMKEILKGQLNRIDKISLSFYLFPVNDSRFYSSNNLPWEKLDKETALRIASDKESCIIITGSMYLYSHLNDYGL